MAGARERHEVVAEDELVRRLRDLDWPKPPQGLRERSLEDFQRRLEEAEAEAAAAAAAASVRKS